MKKTILALIAFILATSILASPVSAAHTRTGTQATLGQLKVCKVAGSGVTQGELFTFRVGSTTYSIPAGPPDRGYCVLAGQYPVDSQVTIEEVIPAGYYVSRIEVKPNRIVSKDTAKGTVTLKIVSGVIEAIFTNQVSGPPTPTRTPTSLTPNPTKTATPTPGCGTNCPPTVTPTPTGRMQICKEADGPGVTGYFTFRFNSRSRSVPVGACAGLISVEAGTLTITEDSQTGYTVSDIYTIPADRLLSKDLLNRRVRVRIVEGTAASQTIIIFRNRLTSVTSTFTPTATATSTATGTATPTFTSTPTGTLTSTATATPTGTITPPVCVPFSVTADFSQFAPGTSVEGMDTVAPGLNIDAKGNAVKIQEGVPPVTYGADNLNAVLNGGLVNGSGFSDSQTQSSLQPHLFTFTFEDGLSVNSFSLRMVDFGDFDPGSADTQHYAVMTAYNANGAVLSTHELSYDTPVPYSSPTYGNLFVTGDAILSQPGQPGNWTWQVTGNGIVRVVLEFGTGFDPNVGFDTLTYCR